MDSVYEGKVCGLCGNYDQDSNNDFETPTNDIVASSVEFGNSWRLKTSCPPTTASVLDMCDKYPSRRSWAERQCSIILSDIFADCHSEVDRGPYYADCLSDTCGCEAGGDCECFCTAVASYAHACGMKGHHIEWRSPSTCPTMCEQYNKNDTCEWRFETCGTACPDTCCHINEPCGLPCVEGCFPNCPFNHVFDEIKQSCISVSECPTCPVPTTAVTTTATTIFTSKATTQRSQQQLLLQSPPRACLALIETEMLKILVMCGMLMNASVKVVLIMKKNVQKCVML
uniref:mucin-2-like n=1 Tax=Styela clava TaxID=7725 RepID=UPI001939A7E3|nr:mucin-2-like [Styela clava]